MPTFIFCCWRSACFCCGLPTVARAAPQVSRPVASWLQDTLGPGGSGQTLYDPVSTWPGGRTT